MTDRSHLSIGEVLSLLQGEFPDLTITKIRFLESQGLIDPERTPSGYRKFYEPDIDRLRWILHQQRENFLPLKVIKDRLDEAGDELPPLDEVVVAAVPPVQQLALGELPGSNDGPVPVWMADHARAAAGGRPEAVPASVPAASGAAARPPEAPVPAAAPRPAAAGPEALPGEPPSTPPAAVKATPAKPAAPAKAGGAPPPSAARPPVVAAKPPPGSAPEPRVDFPAAALAGPREPTRASGPLPTVPVPVSPQTAASAPPAASPLDAGPSGASFSFDELLVASGLTAAQARELEQYGLIEAGTAAGDPIYDEEAVVIGRKAAAFFRHGAEPRHLRMFKVSADREAGFLEQIILPLVKQRNPAARQQALSALTEMSALGEALHASFLRQALRDHLT